MWTFVFEHGVEVGAAFMNLTAPSGIGTKAPGQIIQWQLEFLRAKKLAIDAMVHFPDAQGSFDEAAEVFSNYSLARFSPAIEFG